MDRKAVRESSGHHCMPMGKTGLINGKQLTVARLRGEIYF